MESLEVIVVSFQNERGLWLTLDQGDGSRGERKVKELEGDWYLLELGVKVDRKGHRRAEGGVGIGRRNGS